METSVASAAAGAEAPSHPEEMRGRFALRIGERTIFEGEGRTTPAGLISAGLAMAAAAFALGYLVRAVRTTPRRRRF